MTVTNILLRCLRAFKMDMNYPKIYQKNNIKELDYVLVKKEDYDIMSDESRELAYMKLEQAGVLDKNRRSI